MPNWILVIVIIGHTGSKGDEPMTSSRLAIATHEARDAAAAELRAHLVGTAFAGGSVPTLLSAACRRVPAAIGQGSHPRLPLPDAGLSRIPAIRFLIYAVRVNPKRGVTDG